MASLLILTQPLQHIVSCLPKVLEAASKHTRNRLYVHFDQLALKQSNEKYIGLPFKSYIISSIYSLSPTLCPNIDIRVLLHGFKCADEIAPSTHQNVEKILIDYQASQVDYASLEKRYNYPFSTRFIVLINEKGSHNPHFSEALDLSSNGEGIKTYNYVVAGGTFDRIHSGHKILLSDAVIRTNKGLTLGVADGPLLKRKVLKELIEPCSQRIENLKNFLTDIDCHLDYNLVKIEEPMGPTSWDPKLQLLVVSDETRKGVDLINNHRKNNGLIVLDYYCIKLYEDSARKCDEEELKFSSSSQRMRILGTRINKPSPNPSIPQLPYVIGLTGGSASGKTNISKKLLSIGAGIVDCDKLGHKAYLKGTQCYTNLTQLFGKEILDNNEEIDRKILGSKVFNNKAKLELLSKTVWPEICKLCDEEIANFRREGKKLVVLDAAVLLEANWDKLCHEVWVSMISREEAVKRIMERDHKSEKDAIKRIDSQMSNEERISKAHIIFCSQWSYEFTQTQIENAWKILAQENIV